MSPHDIKVLLHHYCVYEPWPHGETSAYKASRAWMFKNGLTDREDALARTTDKGVALVKMLCATPLPEQAFTDPRTGKVIEVAL